MSEGNASWFPEAPYLRTRNYVGPMGAGKSNLFGFYERLLNKTLRRTLYHMCFLDLQKAIPRQKTLFEERPELLFQPVDSESFMSALFGDIVKTLPVSGESKTTWRRLFNKNARGRNKTLLKRYGWAYI